MSILYLYGGVGALVIGGMLVFLSNSTFFDNPIDLKPDWLLRPKANQPPPVPDETVVTAAEPYPMSCPALMNIMGSKELYDVFVEKMTSEEVKKFHDAYDQCFK